jgi:hypothetical protein
MTSDQLRQSISAHNPDARRARQNLITLRAEIARYEFSLGFELTNAGSGHPDEPRTGWVNQSEVLDSLARYQLAERLILASPVAETQIPALDALFAEIAAAEAREAEAAAVESAARIAVEAAEESARLKLLAKVAADPSVVKARANLAGIKRLGQPLDPEPLDLDRELIADFH